MKDRRAQRERLRELLFMSKSQSRKRLRGCPPPPPLGTGMPWARWGRGESSNVGPAHAGAEPWGPGIQMHLPTLTLDPHQHSHTPRGFPPSQVKGMEP